MKAFFPLMTMFWLMTCVDAFAERPFIHMGADWRKMSVWDCKNKSAQAMQDNERFIHTDRTGNQTWGDNGRTFVLVSCNPINDSIYIVVAAAGDDNVEAERLRNSIRKHVFDAPPPVARYPDHYNSGSPPGPHVPAMHWGFDSRPKDLNGCVASAQRAMTANGLSESVSDIRGVWGVNNSVAVFADCLPIPPGVFIHIVSTSYDSGEAERYRNAVRAITFQ